MGQMVMTSIYITPAQKRALMRRAKQRRTTLSEEIRSALYKHLHEIEEPDHASFAMPSPAPGKTVDRMVKKLDKATVMLADMQIEVNAMRHLMWKAASQLEQGTDATRATQLAVTYARRKTMKIADDGLQIFGGHGFIREYPVEMWYRNTRTVTVLEGLAAL